MLQVLLALRADAWLHAYGDPQSEQDDRSKLKSRRIQLRNRLVKGMVAGQSLLSCRQAIAGFRSKPAFKTLDQVVVGLISNNLCVEGACAASRLAGVSVDSRGN